MKEWALSSSEFYTSHMHTCLYTYRYPPYSHLSSYQMKEWALSSSDTYVTRNEFCLAMLLRLDKISAEDLRLVQQTFEQLDASGSGRLEKDSPHGLAGRGHRRGDNDV